MAAYTPILILGGLSAANAWWQDKADPTVVLKPLVATGVASVIAAGLAKIDGLEPVVTAVGWLALTAWLVVTATQKNSVTNEATSLVKGL